MSKAQMRQSQHRAKTATKRRVAPSASQVEPLEKRVLLSAYNLSAVAAPASASSGSVSESSPMVSVASQLAFSQQPAGTSTGTTLSPVQVSVEDMAGNVVAGDSSTVTIALTNPAGAVLGGTLTQAAVSGVATFRDLTVNLPGTYTLQATDASDTAVTSASFTVTLAAPGGVQATQGTLSDAVRITWNAVPGAVSYDILRNSIDDSSSAVTIAARVTGTLLYDDAAVTPLVTNYYWVQAQGASATGPVSDSVTGYEVAPSTPALHVSGASVDNASNATVTLTGVNISGLEYNYSGEDVQVLNSEVQAVAGWHANLLRIPLNEDFWFGDAPASDPTDGGISYQATVDSLISYAAAHNIYVMLDLHWSDAGVLGSNLEQHAMPDQDSNTFWQSAALRYANNPTVLFDLYNEPHPTNSFGQPNYAVWNAGGTITETEDNGQTLTYASVGMQTLLNTIRQSGARNIVAAEGAGWAGSLAVVGTQYALTDPAGNLVYEAHINPQVGQDASDWNSVVSAAAGKYPILIGAWGAEVDPSDTGKTNGTNNSQEPAPSADAWVQNLLTWMTQNKYGWAAWSFNTDTLPVLLTSDTSYAPTSYFGAYVQSDLTTGQVSAAPGGLSITGTDQWASVTWNAVADGQLAVSYDVFRNTSDDPSTATEVAWAVNATSFVDATVQPGGVYYYWVRATDSAGTGADFAATAADIRPETAFATLTGGNLLVQGTSGNDTITLQTDGSGNLIATLNGVSWSPIPLSSLTSIDVEGAAGDDLITLGSGVPAASTQGGPGADTITANNGGNDSLGGGKGPDVIAGGSGDDLIHGGKGFDSITAGTGNDTIFGGLGNDTLRGGPGDDVLNGGAGTNKLHGGTGINAFYAVNGTADRIFAGTAANDSLFYSTADNPIIVTGTIPPANIAVVA